MRADGAFKAVESDALARRHPEGRHGQKQTDADDALQVLVDDGDTERWDNDGRTPQVHYDDTPAARFTEENADAGVPDGADQSVVPGRVPGDVLDRVVASLSVPARPVASRK